MTTTVLRHKPTDECDGGGVSRLTFAKGGFDVVARHEYRCPECDVNLCACELSYGHDCE
jgi:hypothetical protein